MRGQRRDYVKAEREFAIAIFQRNLISDMPVVFSHQHFANCGGVALMQEFIDLVQRQIGFRIDSLNIGIDTEGDDRLPIILIQPAPLALAVVATTSGIFFIASRYQIGSMYALGALTITRSPVDASSITLSIEAGTAINTVNRNAAMNRVKMLSEVRRNLRLRLRNINDNSFIAQASRNASLTPIDDARHAGKIPPMMPIRTAAISPAANARTPR